MSNFYIQNPDQCPNFNYVHPYFKEYTTHGSETICSHNINYGLDSHFESFTLPNEVIDHIENCLIQNIKQGELVITIFNEVYYGWWAIVK